jgi:hypothetical protein
MHCCSCVRIWLMPNWCILQTYNASATTGWHAYIDALHMAGCYCCNHPHYCWKARRQRHVKSCSGIRVEVLKALCDFGIKMSNSATMNAVIVVSKHLQDPLVDTCAQYCSCFQAIGGMHLPHKSANAGALKVPYGSRQHACRRGQISPTVTTSQYTYSLECWTSADDDLRIH